jgi:hypothetical protein
MMKPDKINDDATEADSTKGEVGDVETAGETTAAVAISGPPDTRPVGADTMVEVDDAREPVVSGEND